MIACGTIYTRACRSTDAWHRSHTVLGRSFIPNYIPLFDSNSIHATTYLSYWDSTDIYIKASTPLVTILNFGTLFGPESSLSSSRFHSHDLCCSDGSAAQRQPLIQIACLDFTSGAQYILRERRNVQLVRRPTYSEYPLLYIQFANMFCSDIYLVPIKYRAVWERTN